MLPITITEADIKEIVRKMKNWTAAGIHVIPNFWWKPLPSTHGVLALLIHAALGNTNIIPDYYTHGMTHMIPRKEDRTD